MVILISLNAMYARKRSKFWGNRNTFSHMYFSRMTLYQGLEHIEMTFHNQQIKVLTLHYILQISHSTELTGSFLCRLCYFLLRKRNKISVQLVGVIHSSKRFVRNFCLGDVRCFPSCFMAFTTIPPRPEDFPFFISHILVLMSFGYFSGRGKYFARQCWMSFVAVQIAYMKFYKLSQINNIINQEIIKKSVLRFSGDCYFEFVRLLTIYLFFLYFIIFHCMFYNTLVIGEF